MSFDFSTLKWGRIVIGVIVGFVIALLVNILLQVAYGVVLGFQMRGAPPQEMIIAAVKTPVFQFLTALFVFLGGLVGGRIAARPDETNRQLAGLITGVLLAILAVIWRAFSWGAADFWMLIQAVLAVVGGWLGGLLAGRRKDEDLEEAPQLEGDSSLVTGSLGIAGVYQLGSGARPRRLTTKTQRHEGHEEFRFPCVRGVFVPLW